MNKKQAEERIKKVIAEILSMRYGVDVRGLSADDLMRMAKEKTK